MSNKKIEIEKHKVVETGIILSGQLVNGVPDHTYHLTADANGVTTARMKGFITIREAGGDHIHAYIHGVPTSPDRLMVVKDDDPTFRRYEAEWKARGDTFRAMFYNQVETKKRHK